MTNRELKTRGKAAFRRFYWRSFLVALVLYIFCLGGASETKSRFEYRFGQESKQETYYNYNFDDFDDIEDLDFDSIINNQLGVQNNTATRSIWSAVSSVFSRFTGGLFIAGLAAGSIVWILVGIFVFKPLEIGGDRYFIENAEGADCPADTLLFAFRQKDNYIKIVATLFLRELFTALWTLLFIIPGIVKSYSYKMIPYLLADYPDMDRKEAFRLSMDMMNGNKMRAFILDISFIGWYILEALTLGLVGIFYSNPYRYATYAELYLDISTAYFRTHGNPNGGYTQSTNDYTQPEQNSFEADYDYNAGTTNRDTDGFTDV